MVSALTFDDVSEAYERYLLQVEPDATDSARGRLADWLEDVGGEDAGLARDVRVVLVSGEFDWEITTTVLWLDEVYGLNIQCVRFTPCKVGERLLRSPAAFVVRARVHRRAGQTQNAVDAAMSGSSDSLHSS
jgi:hypothetical protein